MPIDPETDLYGGFIPDHQLSYGIGTSITDDGNQIQIRIMFTVSGAVEYPLTEQGVADLDQVAQDLVDFLANHPKLSGYASATKLWDRIQSITPTPSEG